MINNNKYEIGISVFQNVRASGYTFLMLTSKLYEIRLGIYIVAIYIPPPSLDGGLITEGVLC